MILPILALEERFTCPDLNDTVEIVLYSNIHGADIQGVHVFGESVIDEDPLFENLSLLIPYHYSPCVDAGTTGYTCLCGQNFLAPWI